MELEDCVPQFKVGDTVIITIPDSYKYCKVPFGIVPNMVALNGICTRIQRVIEKDYDKENFSHTENLDGCKYYLEGNTYYWPNCLLTKVASYGSDYDIDVKVDPPSLECLTDLEYLREQYPETLSKYLSAPTRDTCTAISNPIKEDKVLIKVKSKKLKLNFKN